MRKFRLYLSILVTFPAAIIFLLAMFLIGVAGAVEGEGFKRTYRIVAEEFLDAVKFSKARLAAGNKR